MPPRHAKRFAALTACLSVLLALTIAEGVVRQRTSRDSDGNVRYGKYWLRPRHLPIHRFEESLADWRRGGGRHDWNRDLGWSPRPGYRSDLYTHDLDGRRIMPQGPPGAPVVVTLGDSFTYGSEVGDTETWPARLAAHLQAQGIPARVMNLGVSAYGHDQALLRFRHDSLPLNPSVVVLGFTEADIHRNLTGFHALWSIGGGAGLKPRFVLGQEGLELQNHPLPTPDEGLEVLRTLGHDDPGYPEELYTPELYSPRWWGRFRLAQLLDLLVGPALPGETRHYPPESPEGRLTIAIVDQLAAEVKAAGAEFAILNWTRMPSQDETAKDGGAGESKSRIIAELASRHRVVDGFGALRALRLRTGSARSLRMSKGHWSPAANDALAAELARELAGWLDSADHSRSSETFPGTTTAGPQP